MNKKFNIKPIAIVIIVVGFLFLLKSQFPHYRITSSNMSPSLKSGNIILVDKIISKTGIKNNDVCVFEMKDEFHISRIVGLPGDKVQIINGVLFVNDIQETQIRTRFTYKVLLEDHPALSEYDLMLLLKPVTQFEEYTAELTDLEAKEIATYDFVKSINKIVHPKGYHYSFSKNPIFPNRSSFNWSVDNFGPITIPEKGEILGVNNFVVENDYYFAIGDNRHQSLDSRYWGFISGEQIQGKMIVKLY